MSRSLKLAALAAVSVIGVWSCSSGPTSSATVTIVVNPVPIDDKGMSSTITVQATDETRKSGSGSIKITTAAGSLTGNGTTATLDNKGQGTAMFTCAVGTDPNCSGLVKITAEWKRVGAGTVTNFRQVEVGNNGGGVGGGAGGGVGGGTGGGVAGGAGGGGPPWNWQNPSPQSQDLNGIWSSSSSDAWTVGYGGAIIHWNGTGWSNSVSGTTSVMGLQVTPNRRCMKALTASRYGRYPMPKPYRLMLGSATAACMRARAAVGGARSASPAPRSITSTPRAISSRLRCGMVASG